MSGGTVPKGLLVPRPVDRRVISGLTGQPGQLVLQGIQGAQVRWPAGVTGGQGPMGLPGIYGAKDLSDRAAHRLCEFLVPSGRASPASTASLTSLHGWHWRTWRRRGDSDTMATASRMQSTIVDDSEPHLSWRVVLSVTL